MKILCIRTDKPEAELYLYDGAKELKRTFWRAHRELSTTLHQKVDEILESVGLGNDSLEGIVIYKGPGSFTGLRIGFSVANAMASILKIPIMANMGDDWLQSGIKRLIAGENQKVALPEYGSKVNITKPKK